MNESSFQLGENKTKVSNWSDSVITGSVAVLTDTDLSLSIKIKIQLAHESLLLSPRSKFALNLLNINDSYTLFLLFFFIGLLCHCLSPPVSVTLIH